MSSERDPKRKTAIKRVDEIKGHGQRHRIDRERVATWITEGRSVDAVRVEILEEIASRSARPITTPMAAEHRDEIDRKSFEQQFRRNSKEQSDVDREILRQVGCRSAKLNTTSMEAEHKDEQREGKLDREPEVGTSQPAPEATDKYSAEVSSQQRISDEKIDDRAVSRQPSQRVAVGSRAPRSRSRSQSPRKVDPRKGMIAKFKSRGENRADRIAVLMDEEIGNLPTTVQLTYAPLDVWKKDAPSHLRTWKEFLDHKATHQRIRNYINCVPPLPSKISKKAN